MTDTNTSHYHVLAVQDWGGSTQHDRGWDDRLSLADAQQLVADIVRADTLYMEGLTPDGRDGMQVGEAEFGERFYELISTNVAPGWEAVRLLGCGQPCRFDELFDTSSAWGEPYWIPRKEISA